MTLLDESASSSASNRLTLDVDLTIAAKQAAILRYDGTAARWQAIAGAGTAIGKAVLGARDASAARAALGLATAFDGEVTRQNVLLTQIYQAKLLGGCRRLINAFADGYKAGDGINAGTSGGYTLNAPNGYVYPSLTQTQIDAPAGAAAAQGYTFICRAAAVPNGTKVVSVGLYSTIARTIKVKIVLRNSANNYTVVVDQSHSHGGSGWEDVMLSSPYTVPGSGTYYLAAYIPSGASNPNVTGMTSRAYVNSDLTGTGSTTAEDTNTAFPLRYGTTNNMTLVTAAQTTDASVGNGRVLLEYDAIAGVVLNTDLTVEVSCDGGAHWTSAALSGISAYSQGGRAVAETVDQPCTAGTSFAARIKTLTNKTVPIHGVSLTVH